MHMYKVAECKLVNTELAKNSGATVAKPCPSDRERWLSEHIKLSEAAASIQLTKDAVALCVPDGRIADGSVQRRGLDPYPDVGRSRHVSRAGLYMKRSKRRK